VRPVMSGARHGGAERLKFCLATVRRSGGPSLVRHRMVRAALAVHWNGTPLSSPTWRCRWNDVPRGTMDEASSYVRLDRPFV